jgi:hypothetical protein
VIRLPRCSPRVIDCFAPAHGISFPRFTNHTRECLGIKLDICYLGVDATCVSRSARGAERQVADDQEMQKMVDGIYAVFANTKDHGRPPKLPLRP